jgi:hypothetical protein
LVGNQRFNWKRGFKIRINGIWGPRVYSGCQKNVSLNDRFFLKPLIPTFVISELIFEKRYNRLISANPKIKRAQISFLFENEQFFRLARPHKPARLARAVRDGGQGF